MGLGADAVASSVFTMSMGPAVTKNIPLCKSNVPEDSAASDSVSSDPDSAA